ncbi:hypothetical protein KGQ19_26195 [Catenulispora sp. NL8]|uniref:RiboL-PSP-HEPN domain-containing protein n=1 Tax=Catenulispora pinistramenti TaxID=2705254 RepID=A0ABS5KWE0_9ACTN|nr:hypothetical protein [Catenulispora pinistramenti]MBS2550366.1 hypothetical protein [Catenulispora pinistramenti]
MAAIATPPATEEFAAFTRNLDYARRIVDTGLALSQLPMAKPDANDDLYRAAWVQGVSALDHWLHEELYRRIAAIADDQYADRTRWFRELPLPVGALEDVHFGKLPLPQAVQAAATAKLEFVTLLKPDRIKEALRLVTDVVLWERVADVFNAWGLPAGRHDSKGVQDRLKSVDERRNRIAHRTDLIDGSLTERTGITAQDVTEAIDFINHLGLAITQVLGPDVDMPPGAADDAADRDSFRKRLRAWNLPAAVDAVIRLLRDWAAAGADLHYHLPERATSKATLIVSAPDSPQSWQMSVLTHDGRPGSIEIPAQLLAGRPLLSDVVVRDELRERIEALVDAADAAADRTDAPTTIPLTADGVEAVEEVLSWYRDAAEEILFIKGRGPTPAAGSRVPGLPCSRARPPARQPPPP